MKQFIRLLALAFITLAANAFAATSLTLLAPGAHDQVPTHVIAPVQAKALASPAHAAATLDHTPVHVSRVLSGDQALNIEPTPYQAQSREFWSDVGESQLHSGVAFTTTAPGALIRISPQGDSGATLDPASLMIRSNGRVRSANAISSAVADADALQSVGMPVAKGTLAFRLAPSAGMGEMQLSTQQAHGRFLVQVLDAGSPLVLDLSADRDTVLVGSTITFRTALTNAGAPHGLALASGIVTAPDGYSADLQFVRNTDGSFSATFTPDAAHSVGPQLWEAQVFSASHSGKLVVQRDAKTAFAVSAPTAQFGSDVQLTSDANGMQIDLPVNAASASRYQVSGVLYGTGSDGALHPAALAQSAQWLTSGNGSIGLHFDAASLNSASLHAPYELHDLRLIDQANMAVIERLQRALAID
ncbi:MAG: DUF4785 domain-containing protein [Rudaea sp.]